MNEDMTVVLQGHIGGEAQLDKLFHIPLDLYLPSGPGKFPIEWLLNGY